MQSLSNIFWIFIALCGFGLLITAHELGHLFAAKKAGVRVNEFWVGMGPRVLQKQWGETLYCLCLLPVGGACVMEGEDDNTNPDPRAFNRVSRFRRFTILIAGVLMNFVLGFLIVLLLLVPAKQIYTTTISAITGDTLLADTIGLQVGDRITEMNGYAIWQRSDLSTGSMYAQKDGTLEFTVLRDGIKTALNTVTIGVDVTEQQVQQGMEIDFAVVEATPWVKLRESFFTAANYARAVWDSLVQLVSGTVGMDMLSGPVGVTSVMAQTAAVDIRTFGWILAFISVNLGVMNLLPIPGLDGGRLLFLAIETVLRRPLPKKFEIVANTAGLLAMFALIFYVTGNDILRLIQGG